MPDHLTYLSHLLQQWINLPSLCLPVRMSIRLPIRLPICPLPHAILSLRFIRPPPPPPPHPTRAPGLYPRS
jgi:hypothetical protein